ncbi:Hypothetical predicted protein, partial [Mytilus galloprovincialis]
SIVHFTSPGIIFSQGHIHKREGDCSNDQSTNSKCKFRWERCFLSIGKKNNCASNVEKVKKSKKFFRFQKRTRRSLTYSWVDTGDVLQSLSEFDSGMAIFQIHMENNEKCSLLQENNLRKDNCYFR